MNDRETTRSAMPNAFDGTYGSIDQLQHVLRTPRYTDVIIPPFGIGGAITYIAEMVRIHSDDGPDQHLLFLQVIEGDDKPHRLVIPHKVIEAIVRQRDALSTKLRRKLAKQNAQARKTAGLAPAFLKNPGRGGRARKRRARRAKE